jgi:hypothetical protein
MHLEGFMDEDDPAGLSQRNVQPRQPSRCCAANGTARPAPF